MQANEVIKVITGVGETLSGRLFLFDAAVFMTRTLNVSKNPNTQISGLINYEQFCGVLPRDDDKPLKEITVQELKALVDGNVDYQLIDVREPFEYEIGNLNGELIPLSQIGTVANKISRDKKVCYSLSLRRSFSQCYPRVGTALRF